MDEHTVALPYPENHLGIKWNELLTPPAAWVTFGAWC